MRCQYREHPFGITGDDVRRLVEVFGLVDDAIAHRKMLMDLSGMLGIASATGLCEMRGESWMVPRDSRD